MIVPGGPPRPARRAARSGRETAPPDLQAAVGAFLAHLRVERGLATATIRAYGADLGDFATSPEGARGWAVGPEPALDYLARLAGGGSGRGGRALRPTSLRRRTASLRAFYRFALAEDLLAVDVASHLDLPREPRILPDPLTVAEVERLLAAVDPDAIAAGREARAVPIGRPRPSAPGEPAPRWRRCATAPSSSSSTPPAYA